MKKLINAIDQVENQMVTGMAKAYPQYLRKLDCGNVVVRADKKEGKVALISGGGSGHEPIYPVLFTETQDFAGAVGERLSLQ